MKPSELSSFLVKAIDNNFRVLVKGKPGIGKSDIFAQACAACGAELVISHPAIADPTDFKGMPALSSDGNSAHFLPFGDLLRLVNATRKTVCFFDDIGQAPPAVQAALMQLVLARQVNGTRISDHVVFMGATNDTSHCAGVGGMIEPLKSRWDCIVELEVSTDDWCNWALDNGLDIRLIAFIRFRPALLSDFHPTKELRNSPSPRGWYSVSKALAMGIETQEVIQGAVGEGATIEFLSFLGMYASLPNLDSILLDPSNSDVPDSPAAQYAVASGLARKATPANFGRIVTYLNRMPKEFEVMSIRDAQRLNPKVCSTPAYVSWSTKNAELLS